MVFTKKRDKSPSSTPVPSTEPLVQTDGSQLPAAQWEAMQAVLTAVYDHRTDDGFDPSKLFHRKVNKRVIPEYYDTIKEPVALSTIKAKIHTRVYASFGEFVRDFALIPHNAQVFNRPDSGAFQDALVIKGLLERQLGGLVERGVITKEVAELPDLGEIPTYEDVATGEGDAEGEEDEESDEEGEEDEEDDAEEDEDGTTKRKYKKRGPRTGAASTTKREPADEDGNAASSSKRARGRPPKLLTPMEARIQSIIKGIRKPKDPRGRLMIKTFDRLPDKTAMPEYYTEVKQPMAYDLLKRKVKRKKYRSVEDFMADVNLMFNNAKAYNTDDSTIHTDAVALQIEAGRLYDLERAKPDSTFADDEGKIPMPNGLLHNGELYKVGDWIHLRNPNDLTKPIPAQIYRAFKNSAGEGIVNVCWYYRPEQTVHRFDKHFLANEVVKTGRYRDHHVEEIEGRCFIMFTTRYFKGRPRNLPEGIEVYVCEARYNKTLHQFNRIKTWASCLPDEVRDKDYEMDLFEHSRRMKKWPSPIRYLLREEQKETDELPKVTWGVEGAPPRIGAVHRRPRGERDSPPPEPTPPPPPAKVAVPPQQRPAPAVTRPSYGGQGQQQSPAVASTQQLSSSTANRPLSYNTATSSSHNPQLYNSNTTQAAHPSPSAPRLPSQQQHHQPIQPPSPALPRPTSTALPTASAPLRPGTGTGYRDPAPIEVYILPDQANLSIPAELREQFAQDRGGRVLFFTTPPVAVFSAGKGVGRGHSVRFMAEKARVRAQKRAREAEGEEEEEAGAKRAKLTPLDSEVDAAGKGVQALKKRALLVLEQQLRDAVNADLGDGDLGQLAAAQDAAMEQQGLVEQHRLQRKGRRAVGFGGAGV